MGYLMLLDLMWGKDLNVKYVLSGYIDYLFIGSIFKGIYVMFWSFLAGTEC
ncbi:Uncharacterised protein [Yersinia enterocolitica]|nr:Uncharacterised protein [Yersinia mollaretii]CNK31497.1 Uncharacterised protein [Yersinia enterocolitica]CQQ14954.1 Uncharacterised protein [Yersinia mollaretii]